MQVILWHITWSLYWLLQTAGLNTKFVTDGHYTVFAPNNNVFSGLPAGTLDYFRSAQVRLLYLPNISLLWVLKFSNKFVKLTFTLTICLYFVVVSDQETGCRFKALVTNRYFCCRGKGNCWQFWKITSLKDLMYVSLMRVCDCCTSAIRYSSCAL